MKWTLSTPSSRVPERSRRIVMSLYENVHLPPRPLASEKNARFESVCRVRFEITRSAVVAACTVPSTRRRRWWSRYSGSRVVTRRSPGASGLMGAIVLRFIKKKNRWKKGAFIYETGKFYSVSHLHRRTGRQPQLTTNSYEPRGLGRIGQSNAEKPLRHLQ
jgi:hypothetical protein